MPVSTAPKQTMHSCGCVNELHEPTGALRRVSTCQRHTRAQRAPETLGLDYYTKLGLLRNGMLQPTNHVAELTEALGEIPAPKGNGDVMEIGCGVSPYAGVLIERGWKYMGVEPSLWACGWMRRIHGVDTLPLRFEQVEVMIPPDQYGLILAAHSIEHMDDAPVAIARCAELLAPGGQLWIVIPDDTDKVNPDHRWLFTQESLWYTVESAGLTVEHITLRRYVKHENFLYVRAIKPSVSNRGQQEGGNGSQEKPAPHGHPAEGTKDKARHDPAAQHGVGAAVVTGEPDRFSLPAHGTPSQSDMKSIES